VIDRLDGQAGRFGMRQGCDALAFDPHLANLDTEGEFLQGRQHEESQGEG
jgi:hypothetical protein